METCEVEGCETAALAKNLCRKHYMRMWRKGSTDDTRKNARKPCSEEGCERSAAAHGKCEKHYRPAHRRLSLIEQRAAEARPCLHCGKQIPAERTRRAKFCSASCKTAHGNRPEIREQRGFGDEYMRGIQLRKWELTPAEYDSMLQAQGGGCALCGGPSGWTTRKGKPGRFHVDHCHTAEYATGTIVVRGLLCRSCNLMLGHVQDSVDTLLAAVEYLRRHREEAVDLEGHEAEGRQAAG